MRMFMDPTYDFIFKRLFGSNDHIHLSKSFINALCRFKGKDKVETVKFLNQEQLPGNTEIRLGKTTVDIYCENQWGHKFIVEMQRAPETDFVQRLMLYFSRMYASQYEPTFNFEELYPVIVIAVALKIPALKHKKSYRSMHVMLDEETHERDIKEIGFVLVELDKFCKQENDLVTDEDKWLFLLKTIGSAREVPEALETGLFKEACDLLNLMKMDKMVRMEYENTEALLQSLENTKRDEEIRVKAEGRAEGRAEGKAEGRAEGIAEGEHKAKLELARNLLAEKMSVELIAKLTGLSVEEIQKL